MLLGWLKRRREYRERVEAEAGRLHEVYGRGAYAEANKAVRAPSGDYQFAIEVRSAVARRIGHQPGLDNATRRFIDGHG